MAKANRIEAVVTMTNIYRYTRPAYGYGEEERYIYTMQDEEGTVYVWKTGTFFVENIPCGESRAHFIDKDGKGWDVDAIRKGDVLKIKASVKGQGEYKGQPQTEIQRVKLVERISKGKTWEEILDEKEAAKNQKKREQQESIREEDLVMTMPYRQYKEHYSDCETVIDSYENRNGNKVIQVIIRDGRLKASGVRGKHFAGFQIEFTMNGKRVYTTFRAVCEENAMKQWKRKYKNGTDAVVVEVYR